MPNSQITPGVDCFDCSNQMSAYKHQTFAELMRQWLLGSSESIRNYDAKTHKKTVKKLA